MKYCCDEFKFDKECYDSMGSDDASYDPDFKYCPWCGKEIEK